MTKRAVVVGINDYSQMVHPGWSFPTLHGCVNDANAMYHLLIDVFGFDPTQVFLYTDRMASSLNIQRALAHTLQASEAGDVVCFYFSGHGGRFSEEPGHLDSDRAYEGIIPASGDFITDFDLFRLADSLNPSFVNFTVILDSCFSGGLQNQDELIKCRTFTLAPERAYIDTAEPYFDTIIPIGVCIPPSSTVMNNNVTNVHRGSDGMPDMDIDPDKTLVQFSKSTLISASRFYELSMEDSFNGVDHGFFTQSFLELVNSRNAPGLFNFSISYRDLMGELHTRVAEKVVAHRYPSGYTQTPQLMGQMNRMDEAFLAGWTDSR